MEQASCLFQLPGATPCSLLPAPDSRFPIPYSLFPIPYSLYIYLLTKE
ncbi:MAG: hypothetical protein F6J98_15815 [Moorea sp. SIO4G2]|nr:hypothetical protein [Moorena sp. SIO4G2]